MFHQQIAKIHNSAKSRSLIVCGNVYDLFWNEKEFVPLIPFLLEKTKGPIQIVYELNGPIRIEGEQKTSLKKAWITWKTGDDPNTVILKDLKNGKNNLERLSQDFEKNILDSIGNPTLALEFLRQLTICSRKSMPSTNLLIIIEAADMLLPAGTGDVASLNDNQLHRIAIVQDWLSDPAFISGGDSVLFIAESRSLIHPRISRLPQVLSVEVPAPDLAARRKMIEVLRTDHEAILDRKVDSLTAGLSLHALRQLLKDYDGTLDSVILKVEEYIQSQVGEDVVEFKKPKHKLDDCVGNENLKRFLRTYLIPRMKLSDDSCLSGAGVSGPIGCHIKGQNLIKNNGDLILVEDIKVGDSLLGPDSTPRKVLSLIHGFGQMYEIIPIKGKSFIVNEDHVLSLKRTNSSKKNKKDKKSGEIVDVSLKDYLSWSKTRKSLYKLFRVGVDFQNNQQTDIDPYFLGLLLGDGSFQQSPSVTSLDFEILAETIRQSKKFGLNVSIILQEKTKAITLALVGKKNHKNALTVILRKLGLWGKNSYGKFIPKQYLVGDNETRLALLAGLLDTDGSLGHCFDFSNTSETLCDDICFLSRSLGLAAYKSGPFLKKCQNDGESICWRVSISGDLDIIPTRIHRKKAKARRQKKSVLVTGFKTKKLGRDEFYGFTLDGDGRYLMDDFTVTHNSGKTYIFEAVASELDMVILVLKNIRSQWLGQTDVIFERLKRVLMALDRVLIFVDEADTQFGGLGENVHETERRLTGKIQGMMSDPTLKGKIYWLLMTARIHMLSPDIRRPGRVGDLIIPVLDPQGADRDAFLKWALKNIQIVNYDNIWVHEELSKDDYVYTEFKQEGPLNVVEQECWFNYIKRIIPEDYSAASYTSLRSNLKYHKQFNTFEDLVAEIKEYIQPAITLTRRYQTLQALVNCTRRSLLPNPNVTDAERQKWEEEIRQLELQGVK